MIGREFIETSSFYKSKLKTLILKQKYLNYQTLQHCLEEEFILFHKLFNDELTEWEWADSAIENEDLDIVNEIALNHIIKDYLKNSKTKLESTLLYNFLNKAYNVGNTTNFDHLMSVEFSNYQPSSTYYLSLKNIDDLRKYVLYAMFYIDFR